jgi:hypothetical protein
MAYGDLSFFLPQQQYYRNPGDYTGAMKNAALQKANYLAQLDVEMAQLDEAKRQFDKRLVYDYDALNRQTGLEKDRIGVAKDQATTQKIGTYGGLALGLGQIAAPFVQDYSARNWAEEIGGKLGWFDQEQSSGGGGYDFLENQEFSSSAFDPGSIDTSFGLDTWSQGFDADPLLDYEFDFGW